jgi:hypothetical protein
MTYLLNLFAEHKKVVSVRGRAASVRASAMYPSTSPSSPPPSPSNTELTFVPRRARRKRHRGGFCFTSW